MPTSQTELEVVPVSAGNAPASVLEDEESDLVDELLVEEISIDGMCGVY